MTTTAPVTTALTWRPLTVDDAPLWFDLVQAIEAADDPAERYTRDDLVDELTDGSWKNPVADSVVGLDADGVARAFGLVEVRPGDTHRLRAFCWGGVHPRWRGRGIGREVLRWQEARSREKVAATQRAVPAHARAHTEEHLADARHLLERAGFAATRWFVDMSRTLDAAVPDVALTGDLRLVPYDPSLAEAVRLAHNESFAGHWGSEPRAREDWERHTVGGRDFRPGWSFVVLDGDEVAGYTLASAYEQDWAAQGYAEGWTDLLGVRPGWRRRGIAPALLTASMRAFAADGMARAGLGVDTENGSGALGLYTRLGYEAERRSIAYVKEL